MATTLLATKTNFPFHRPNLVIRHRLAEKLDPGLRCKLTIVSAPAGFGKTTLVREWIHQQNVGAAWLSLDEGDRDPVRFLAYSIKALQTLMPDLGESILEELHTPHPQSAEQYAGMLINEIVAAGPEHFVLVLDDYHLVDTPPIHRITNFILDNQPQAMHLILSTRSDPSISVARLRGQGEVIELRQGDLQFNSEEAGKFLNQSMGLHLTPEQVSALATRAEGWIAGLQMAAVSMQGRDDIPSFIRSFTGSNRYILDYLVEEVLHHQPEHIQRFLLQTSILERFTGSLCDALTGGADSQSVIEYLERSNLFITPLDDERRWYRYHHLFADLLNKQLMQASPEMVSKLQENASIWFEEQQLAEEAIQYALAAKDYERAAHLLGPNIYPIMGRGEMSTLVRFFDALPDEFVRNHPVLSIQQVWRFAFLGQLSEAEARLEEIEGKLAANESKDVYGNIAIIRALIASIRGDDSTAATLAQQAGDLLSTGSVEARTVIPYILGNGYLGVGDLERAEAAFEQIKKTGYAAGNLWTVAIACSRLTHLKKLQGRLRDARNICEEVLQIAAARGANWYGFLGVIYFELGDLLREHNDLKTALEMTTRALDLIKLWEIPTNLISGLIILARIHLAQMDLEAAAGVFRKIHMVSRQGELFSATRKYLAACQVRLWLLQENLIDACRWADNIDAELQPGVLNMQIDPSNEVDCISLVRVRIAQGVKEHRVEYLEQARRLLAQLETATRRGYRNGRLIEVLVLQALVFEHLDLRSDALAALESGLSLAISEGYMRVFLDEGQAMCGLLRRAKSKGIFPAYVSKLLDAFDDEIAIRSQPTEPETSTALFTPLSDREMEVLLLLPSGMTATEMAEHLFVAKSTIDTHIKHIYSKLGVKRRMEAIQRARELALM